MTDLEYFEKRKELEQAFGSMVEQKLYSVFPKELRDRVKTDIARYIIGYLGVHQDWVV